MPIGLLDASWSGTRIEPWTPLCGFQAVPALKAHYDKAVSLNRAYRKGLADALTRTEEWVAAARKAVARDGSVPPMPAVRHPLGTQYQETGLYNGMIHPLTRFAIRGALWYQGEANVYEGMRYHDKMKGLILGWR